MKNNRLSFVTVSALMAAIVVTLGFDMRSDAQATNNAGQLLPGYLQSYEIRGYKLAFYLVAEDLDKEQLLRTANEIHQNDSSFQLLLVDDNSGIDDYVKHLKALSAGVDLEDIPSDWADKHIVANVQKYINGRWVLCDGNTDQAIADLD